MTQLELAPGSVVGTWVALRVQELGRFVRAVGEHEELGRS